MSRGRLLSEASARSGLALVAAGAVCLLACIGAICVSPAVAKVHLPRRECPNVGPPNTDVGLYKIITRRIPCGKARAILRRWYHDPSRRTPDRMDGDALKSDGAVSRSGATAIAAAT